MSTSTDVEPTAGRELSAWASSERAAALPATDTVRSLAEYAAEMMAAKQLGTALAGTSFVPKAFRGKPDECAAAILTGHELGFPPTSALRAFYPAPDGRMEMYARAMQAVALAHGHDVWVAEQNEDRVVVRGRRKGNAEIREVTWDQDRVRKAKLLKDDGNHAKFPQQMMAARGIAEMSRLVAPDSLHGIYAIEERDEPIEVQAVVGAPIPGGRPAAAKVTAADILEEPAAPAAAAPAATQEAAPSTVDTVAAEVVDAGTVVQPDLVGHLPVVVEGADGEPIIDIGDAPLAMTPEQSATLHGLARAQGRNTKAKLGPLIREVTGRDVADTRELTADEADRVIARLEADGRAQS